MFFNDDVSKKVTGYGIGTTTAKGRYHLLASCEEDGRVQMLCQSCQKKLNGHTGPPPRWFKEEACAVKALRNHKKACQKCLRSIETTELSQ